MQKENIKISSFAFISFSLGAFILVSFLYLFLSAKVHYTKADKKAYGIEELYIKDNYRPDDPYLTKAGGLKRAISGPIISNFDPYLGNFEAPIRIIVYSDFACPYCYKQEAIISKVLDKYDGQLRFIWKDYPDFDKDSISFKSSLAARCAQDQDRFWEFHDGLFTHSLSLNEKYLYELAQELNLDMKDFKDCYSNKKSEALVLSNIEEANAIGVIGVPDVYINDKEFIGSVSEEDFSLIIDTLLENE